ncbi:hypothetical protein RMATCC62417_00725 [Rhizopus microsporus]|nr:hypothetical protein RMATCC62417_00725 [Rhizopus microsporus]
MQSTESGSHKRLDHPYDSEDFMHGLPRKKFISEESFANEMAAMSLDSSKNSITFQRDPNERYIYDINNNITSNKNVVRIDDINQFLEEQEEENDMMPLVVDHTILIDDDACGLPLELNPGNSKPKIPQFVLSNSGLTDPRDKLAIQEMMKHNQDRRHTHIEIIHQPSVQYDSMDMDLD